jgi:hypothetical protein
MMAAARLAVLPSLAAKRWQRALPFVSAAQFAAVSIVGALALVLVPSRFGGSMTGLSALAAFLMLALPAAALVFLARQRALAAAGFALLSALLLYPLLSAGVAPDLNAVWMSRSIAAHVAQDRSSSDPPPVLAGYVEPSLVFLLGTGTRLQTGKAAGATMAQQGGLAIVEDRDRMHFLESLRAAGGRERAIDDVSGFDYSRGRHEHVTFYRVTPAPEETTPPPE